MSYYAEHTIYRNADTAASDAARRFVTNSLIVEDIVITAQNYPQLLGDSSTQDFPIIPGSYWAPSKLDISTLYFKNETAGENGTLRILARRPLVVV